MILKWLFLGNIITMAYKSTLLSSLIPIRYESTIDTLNNLYNSGLPVVLPNNTAPHRVVARDRRHIMKKIYENRKVYPFNGTVPYWVLDR